ncbi:flagellar biosynthesis anti-sigma factor FlgM [Thermogemmatispora onikobensis]|uniref:flagellar biosynthesis anti-sigma factor FlgM n=1 Tax=Thermogemmatispora onikobensis TaxID=732234 RepID=UPI0008535842|nr:flagellar biosynthesis anti-sigma factor FlgM [Thermogemmatispora onikobensis]
MRIRQVTRAGGGSRRSRAALSRVDAAQASASGQSWQPTSLQDKGAGWRPWLGERERDDERYLRPALPRRRRSSPVGSGPDGHGAPGEAQLHPGETALSGPELAALVEQERAERVAALRVRLAAGRYQVDSVALARRMLGDH